MSRTGVGLMPGVAPKPVPSLNTIVVEPPGVIASQAAELVLRAKANQGDQRMTGQLSPEMREKLRS
jgi:hypothetical protein